MISQSHPGGCCCSACLTSSSEQQTANTGSAAAVTSFKLLDIKWGSAEAGSSGGAVTWGFAAPTAAFSMTESAFRAEVEDAFDAIERVADIDFVFVDSGAPAAIQVFWYSDDGPGGTVALASYSYFEREGIDFFDTVEVTFDIADYNRKWSAKQVENSEFFQTALHEIGHAVGLDHVNDPSQIMNPFVVDGVDQLADGDIAGLQYLYGASTVGETTITGTGAGEVINRSAETFNLEIFGLAGDDTITGGTGNDKISGGLGNDRLNGNAGADVLADGFGDNQLYGAAGPDKLVVFSGSNTLHGDAGNDIILGGIGRDSLNGGDGNDTLIGDVLVGSVFNDDTLDGGAGDDLLSGGGGADVFVFRSNGGHDTIANIRLDSFNANPTVGGRDFQPGIDKIDITGLGMAPGSSPLAAVTDVGGNATFAAGGISIEIVGVAKADLSDSDFIWA